MKTRYYIINLKVERAGQLVRFEKKIPSNLTSCTGFLARHVKGFNGQNKAEIGWLTLSFNSVKEQAIVVAVSANEPIETLRAAEYQTLDVELEKNQLVVGVYADTDRALDFRPYSINIYLRCTASPDIPHRAEPIA